MVKEIELKLGAPFPFEEVEAKIQVFSNDKSKGMAVFYVTSRAIQKRLDEVVGAFNWTNQYSAWQEKSQICGIGIYNEARQEWVMKYDGAENTEIEPIKGGLSDAFKRTAVKWGIGRYLYEMDGVWVDLEPRGKSHIIKENQYVRLKAVYDAAVAKMFGNGAIKQTPAGNAASSATQKEASNSQTSQQASAPATPQKASENPTKPVTQVTENKPVPLSLVPPAPEFKIHSMKPSGQTSQLLELCDSSTGEVISAYIKNGEKGIAIGALLRNVKLEEKTGSFGKYNLLASYVAA